MLRRKDECAYLDSDRKERDGVGDLAECSQLQHK